LGTVHALATHSVCSHSRDAGLPQTFQILDSQDQLAAVKRMLKGLNADEDRFPPREVQSFINSQKEEGLRAADVALTDEQTRRFVDFYSAYDEQCRAEGVVDFAELLLRAYELVKRKEVLRAQHQERLRHITQH